MFCSNIFENLFLHIYLFCRTEPKRKPLPKLVLNLMKDNAIKKKLKELGLSSQGDRKVLESRLQRYIILYNAECDKINPRPVSELIRQFEEEENLEKRVQKPSNVRIYILFIIILHIFPYIKYINVLNFVEIEHQSKYGTKSHRTTKKKVS